MTKTKTGTKEWADATVNVQRGCENRCCYCHACARDVRFGGKAEDWGIPMWSKGTDAALRKIQRAKDPLRVMFPSTHDITPGNFSACWLAIVRILEAPAGHSLLIVSKPRIAVVRQLVWDMTAASTETQKRVMFRFSIGTMNEKVRELLEPGAPSIAERLECVRLAAESGYTVTVSAEPLLTAMAEFTVHLVKSCVDAGASRVWIGPMRHWRARMKACGATENQMEIAGAYAFKHSQPAWWQRCEKALADAGLLDRVIWKDEALKMLGRDGRSDRSEW